MKIKQAIAEGHKFDGLECNPQAVFTMVMHKVCEKLGSEEAMSMACGYALEVAKQLDCYFDLDSGNGYGFSDDTFYFWSKQLGDVRPSIFN
jgi:hypothetical protein